MTSLSRQREKRAALVCGLCNCESKLAKLDFRCFFSTWDKLGAQDRCGWGDPWGQMGERMVQILLGTPGMVWDTSEQVGEWNRQWTAFSFCLLTFFSFGNYPFLYFHNTGGTTIQPPPHTAAMSHRGMHVTQASPQENAILLESVKGACAWAYDPSRAYQSVFVGLKGILCYTSKTIASTPGKIWQKIQPSEKL